MASCAALWPAVRPSSDGQAGSGQGSGGNAIAAAAARARLYDGVPESCPAVAWDLRIRTRSPSCRISRHPGDSPDPLAPFVAYAGAETGNEVGRSCQASDLLVSSEDIIVAARPVYVLVDRPRDWAIAGDFRFRFDRRPLRLSRRLGGGAARALVPPSRLHHASRDN